MKEMDWNGSGYPCFRAVTPELPDLYSRFRANGAKADWLYGRSNADRRCAGIYRERYNDYHLSFYCFQHGVFRRKGAQCFSSRRIQTETIAVCGSS